jgi:hypothetical protein
MYYVDHKNESYGVMVMVDLALISFSKHGFRLYSYVYCGYEECTTVVPRYSSVHSCITYGTKFSTLPMTLQLYPVLNLAMYAY